MGRLSFFVYCEDPDVHSHVCGALAATDRVNLVPGASRPSSLEQLLGGERFDGLYLDLSRHADVLLGIVEKCPEPRPTLIFGGSQTDPDVLMRAMRLQPVDFIARHDASSIAQRVEQLAGAPRRASPRPDAHGVLAISGSKGGVGTTLVACELASALQQLGERTVVVDLNLRYGDAALYFDLKPPYTLADVAKKGDALDRTFLDTALATHVSGVRVLCGPSDSQDIGMVGAGHVEGAVQMLREEHDWILFDLPYAWDDLCLRALNLVDQIVLVTTAEVPSLQHTKQQLELLERLGAPDDQVRVLVNRFGRGSPFSGKELAEFLGRAPDLLIPDDETAVGRCVNEGRLLRDVGRGSRAEQAIHRLAELTCEWVRGGAGEQAPKSSWLGQLRKMLRRD
jgi:Flp pilus assembly CpaE family ATPase